MKTTQQNKESTYHEKCPYCNTDLPLEKDEGNVIFKWHLGRHVDSEFWGLYRKAVVVGKSGKESIATIDCNGWIWSSGSK